MVFGRRGFSKLALVVLASGGGAVNRVLLAQENSLQDTAIAVERRLGARLGLAVLDESSGRNWGYQADQRFPMCSTFKLIATGAFLARVDSGHDSLLRRVAIDDGRDLRGGVDPERQHRGQ